ncbi:unnamed protein product, partial [Porites lobata]
VVFISLSVFSLFSGSGLPPASPNQKPVRGCLAGLPRGQSRATFSPKILCVHHNTSAFHVDGAFVKEECKLEENLKEDRTQEFWKPQIWITLTC